MTDTAWEELLAEFRALGGTADNISLRNGAYGRGVFAIDPAKPVSIHVPENLLIDVADAGFESGKFRLGPNSKASSHETVFLENYENTFSWGAGGRDEIEGIFEQAQTLPRALRQTLKSEYHFDDWFEEPDDRLVQNRFIEARCISYKNRTVLMPVMEFINHNSQDAAASHFDTKNGISFGGTFSGEVLARYSDTDAFGAFASWGFASEQPQAFSIPLKGSPGKNAVEVGRDLSSLSQKTQFWIPKVARDEGEVRLQFLMIGNRKYPRLCKGIFFKLMREASVADFEEAFDKIRYSNFSFVTDLLAEIELAEGPMAQTLRRVARYQLQAMSNCFGVRDI
jgi:hypothetical protein